MTGKRRYPRPRRDIRLDDLTINDVLVLHGGCTHDLPRSPDSGLPDIIRRESDIEPVWLAIRAEAMPIEGGSPGHHLVWPSRPGTRSSAWWTFERPTDWDDATAEDTLLDSIGALRLEERRWLHRWATRQIANNCVQAGEGELVQRWAAREN